MARPKISSQKIPHRKKINAGNLIPGKTHAEKIITFLNINYKYSELED